MNLLFLCTDNSCRSQIAEGWARELGGDGLTVQSAGIEAHGKNPRAIFGDEKGREGDLRTGIHLAHRRDAQRGELPGHRLRPRR